MAKNQPKPPSAQPKAGVISLPALNPSGELDRRLAMPRLVKETRQALLKDFHGTARATLAHQVAVNLALQKAIMDHAMANPAGLIEKGKLTPLLAEDLLRLQTNTRAALGELRQLEGGRSGRPKDSDMEAASLVLAACEDEGEAQQG